MRRCGTDGSAIRASIAAPCANAIRERLLGSVRHECLEHILIEGEAHLRRILKEYVTFFNRSQPHHGIDRRVPAPGHIPATPVSTAGKGVSFPALGGFHHENRRAA